ncbi:hypothetical protein Mp_3g00770 [Marchantia polymorpha subsp. ruderalis]|uniref:Uncharacterized protein n=2 Tax=Marchantia polymorpha TaxID=3197 RepID=A0AAF6AW01_MARPO|nr:hypothetical protein MARPO_0007s0073 [Marchantia polymorpha]BBN03935.1 hypothetical protein Mp_3g00770 [Marchantia polymorpha subsp. ruderalis]|eukprot:PTQ47623.1 hypothetical protein MARPO_0007s0073 [Marchantia polymorpha]
MDTVSGKGSPPQKREEMTFDNGVDFSDFKTASIPPTPAIEGPSAHRIKTCVKSGPRHGRTDTDREREHCHGGSNPEDGPNFGREADRDHHEKVQHLEVSSRWSTRYAGGSSTWGPLAKREREREREWRERASEGMFRSTKA